MIPISTQFRPAITISGCDDCIKRKEVAGVLASLGFQFTPSLVPYYVHSTPKCTVIKHFKPRDQYHYVAWPRKDILNIGDISNDDYPYIIDCLNVIKELININGFSNYRILTNGPEKQDVTYLHFHLIVNEFDYNSPQYDNQDNLIINYMRY
jgi:diadenosine tetraphosphate (Ap4A) HIT family hydrolase